MWPSLFTIRRDHVWFGNSRKTLTGYEHMKSSQADSVDSYIASFPASTRMLLTQMRETIRKAAPEAEELMSYQMPAYKLEGMLVYFGGYGKHIGFYPTASGIEAFKQEFSKYKWSKGAVQFPLDQPLPLDLITRIVKFRVAENLEKARNRLK
jgi:uncharacterized protein YdhG (YjbR/CyaY superfamily)